MKAPGIPRELIEYLEAVFPNRLPDDVVPERDLGILVGQQKVLSHLKAVFKVQSRSVIATPT